MKITLPLCIYGCVLMPLAANAQSTVAPDGADNDVVALSAFEVKSSKDSGYRVEKSVSTTGISQELSKTPLPITVVSEQFLKDAELDGFMGALSYMSSVSLDPHAPDGTNSVGYQPNLNRFRGQPFNGTYRNGLKIPYGFGTENVDRVEVAKGPMAVFVGGATLGGELNVVTKKPQFYNHEELFFRTASHDSIAANLDLTGPINKTLAYRVIADYKDGNTWRDYSHSHSEFLNLQLLWRPVSRLSTSIDAFWRDESGNHVSQNVSSTKNYQSDFDTPRQELLDLGKRRTTGAEAGQPYTVAEYRSRIGRAFGTWRQDVFDVTGKWVSLGTADEGLEEGNAPDGSRYNYFGPNSPYTTNVRAVESETIFVANDWLQVRFQGRYLRAFQQDDFVWFGSRIYADGSTPIAGYGGQRWLLTDETGKLEMAVTKKLGWFDNRLLTGLQSTGTNQRFSYAVLDYTDAGSVPGSPNVFGTPATLTGANIYNYFDPNTQAFPDPRLISRWSDDVNAPGVQSSTWTWTRSQAAYIADSTGIWDNRIVFTSGARRSRDITTTAATDRLNQVVSSAGVPQISSTPRIYTSSYMAGLTYEFAPGLNAYASFNKGETYQSGYMVNRGPNAATNVPQDIVPLTERIKYPRPNTTGEGKEVGLKFTTLNNKLTGSIGWFSLERGGIIVVDSGKTANDPRNVGTEVDPNPATADTAVRYKVEWDTAIKGNTTEGFETDLIWTPLPNYTVVLGASRLIKNKMTVDRPPSEDPVVLRTWLVLNGRPLPNSPDTTFRVFQRYSFQKGSLKGAFVSLGTRYQSSQMPSADDVNWGISFPGYWVADVILGYQTKIIKKDVTFQLSCTNVTDKTYFTGNRVYGAPREGSFSTRIDF